MKRQYNLAVGVCYRGEEDQAPTVVVKGEADIADTVVKIARRFGIPVIEDSGLAEAMQSVPLDTEIPEELFRAVAVVLNQVEGCLG